MKVKRAILLLFSIAAVCAAVPAAPGQGSEEVQRITVEELKAKLAAKEPVVVIDTRSENSILSSGRKIRNALQIASDAIEQHLKEIPRDREIVTYCA